MLGIFRKDNDQDVVFTPNADVPAGGIVQAPDGRACINNAMGPALAGVPSRFATVGIVEVEAPSALVLAEGADVRVAADAIAATGGYKLGKLRGGAKVSGQTTIRVALNAVV